MMGNGNYYLRFKLEGSGARGNGHSAGTCNVI